MTRCLCWVGAGCLLLLPARDSHAGGPERTQELPIARPLAAAFSLDGRQVAIGGLEPERDAPADGLVVLVDVATGQQQALLRHSGTIKYEGGSSGSMNMIHEIAYSSDGKSLAVAAELGLKLWDPTTGEELATLAGYGLDKNQRREEITSIAFSPDGALLAATGENDRLRFWNVAKREVTREFKVGYNDHLAYAPVGALLATAGHHNGAALWQAADGKQLAEVNAAMGPLYAVAFDRKGNRIAVGGEGGEMVWRIKKNAAGEFQFSDEQRPVGHFMSAVRYVAFSPDGSLLTSAGDDGALVIYDANSLKPVGTLRSGGPFAFSPDGKSLAVASWITDLLPNGRQRGGTRFALWKTTDVLDVNRLQEQARTAAQDIVSALSSPRPDHRMMQGAATALIGPQGEAATPILVGALANPAVNQKQLLLMPLGKIAERDPAARAAIIEALKSSKEVDVRSMAAGQIGELPDELGKEAVPALVDRALNDENPLVRARAGKALRRLDKAAFQQAAEQYKARGPIVSRVEKRDGQLVYQGRPLDEWLRRLSVSYIPNEIFGRPSPDEPLAAIRAIGPDAVPLLVATLKNGEWPMRRAAAAGLGALGSQAKSAADPLIELMALANTEKRGLPVANTVDLGVSGGAADALAMILKDDKQPPTRLVELAGSDNPAVRLSAARAIAIIDAKHPRGLAVVRAALAASDAPRPFPGMMTSPPFSEPVSAGWLGRVIAADEAPISDRIRAAASLGRMGEGALPALPEMLVALSASDRTLSRQAMLAIQQIGPAAVPAVIAALKESENDQLRTQLATALLGMGSEGRSEFQKYIESLPNNQAESLWWSAASGNWDQMTAMQYQSAAREALERAGQPVQPWRQQFGVMPRPDVMFGRPSVAWSVKLLADEETPRSMRMQSASMLYQAKPAEMRAQLPVLLTAISKEQDRTIVSQLANGIQRCGPEAVPAVMEAIARPQPDYSRRELLRALSSLGKEGQQEFQKLLQFNPEYADLFSGRSRKSSDKRQSSKSRLSSSEKRELTPLEEQAFAEAEKTIRPLTNGNFKAGLQGWNIEGGAGHFHTYPQGDGNALTTFGPHQDAETGRLFQCFKVPDDAKYLFFKVHGGKNRDELYVALWRGDYRHALITHGNNNTPLGHRLDLTPLRGEVVTLEIVDKNKGPWGFIGAEDFRIEKEE